jgi:hypothetical protein
VGALSRELNRIGVPFCAKVPNDPRAYGRADAGVLYLPTTRYADSRRALSFAYADVEDHLTHAVPMFAAPIAPGVAIAEDPRNGLSFGQHRCMIVARGLWRAHVEGRDDARKRAEVIADEFRREGLDPARPFLSSASAYADFGRQLKRPIPRRARPPRAATASCAPGEVGLAPEADRALYLLAATRIGEELIRAAYWNRDAGRCTWMGRLSNPAVRQGGAPQEMTVSLGHDVYNGLAGIAIFLAELYAQSEREEFRRTALGALVGAHYQLHQLGTTAAALGRGFYTGAAGVAYITWRVRVLTDQDNPLSDLAPVFADAASASAAYGRDNDLISGRSGAVMALLALVEEAGLIKGTDRAVAFGEDLMVSMNKENMLTGLAHGAAGYGGAFFALYSHTGREDFLHAGRSAFAFENALFDDDAQNWPDLRTSSHQLRSEDTARFVVTWCNGAAGIALSRLHAMAADPEFRMDYGRQARIGLIATQRQLNDLLAAGTNMSLCHGIAGLVETLWVGSSVLDDPRLGTLAATALHSWLERWGTDDNAYGDFVLSNPGLMVGAAGIGHQCLRMYDPGGVRSILAGPWRAGHSISPRTRQVV